MEEMRMNDDMTQNKNVQKETHKENSQHPLYFANTARDGSTSHRKTTVSSVSTVKGTTTQATSSRTTRTPRPNSNSSLKNTPSKYAQHLLCI